MKIALYEVVAGHPIASELETDIIPAIGHCVQVEIPGGVIRYLVRGVYHYFQQGKLVGITLHVEAKENLEGARFPQKDAPPSSPEQSNP